MNFFCFFFFLFFFFLLPSGRLEGGERKIEGEVVPQDPECDPAARPRPTAAGRSRLGGGGSWGEWGRGARTPTAEPGTAAPLESCTPVIPYLVAPRVFRRPAHWTPSSRVNVVSTSTMRRLDQDLRRRGVERGDQGPHLVDVLRKVAG